MAADEEGQVQHMVIGFDDRQDAVHLLLLLLLLLTLPSLEVLYHRVLHDAGAAVEEALHRLEEAGVVPW